MAADAPAMANWVSPLARRRFAQAVDGVSTPSLDIAGLKQHYARLNQERLDVAMGLFDVTVDSTTIAGVAVHKVTPRSREAGDKRHLICLHGGAFLWGEGPGALLEAVPIAATAGIAVTAVEYRMAPEHRFPAASDDVVAVYRSLCDDRSPAQIGIYGCSAGGILTAQVVARLLHDDLPLPGAIAMLHGTGLELGGDSQAVGSALNGLPHDTAMYGARLALLDYLAAADPDDPAVFPGDHPAVLARFPPSLLVTGTRDMAASALSVMHRRLLAAGAISDFVLFDGMWHAHHVDTDLPESRETFDLLSKFFARNLA